MNRCTHRFLFLLFSLRYDGLDVLTGHSLFHSKRQSEDRGSLSCFVLPEHKGQTCSPTVKVGVHDAYFA